MPSRHKAALRQADGFEYSRLHDHGLAVGARDAHDGDVKLVAVSFRQSLQGFQCADDLQEVGSRIVGGIALGHAGNHEVSHASSVKLWNIVVPVVAFRLQGEKQSLLRETQRAAVGEQEAYAALAVAIASRANERGHFFDSVCHCMSL